MPRPRDEDGRLLPPAHKRLDEAQDIEQAIVFRWAEDGRLCFLPLKRRLTVARRAIDHIHDGASEPKAFLKPDKANPSNTACLDAWRAAVELPDSFFADVTEEHRRQACREMGLPYIPPAVSGQPDLFGGAA